MRRQDIQLLALARQGDPAARCEAGRRYLKGTGGFPQHTATGLEYLTHPNVRGGSEAAVVIAESLSLGDIILLRQEDALRLAAASDSTDAQVKLAAWLFVRYQRVDEGMRWLRLASESGHAPARRALDLDQRPFGEDRLPQLLGTLHSTAEIDTRGLAILAVRRALDEPDLKALLRTLSLAMALIESVTAALAELCSLVIVRAEAAFHPLQGVDPKRVESCLDFQSSRGDRNAAFYLGRALCGIAVGALSPLSLTAGQNMRKGVALLLRAADAGRQEAWLHLYRMHADHRLSVANPQMARFCLEKAALSGQSEAQRKLGALVLRGAASLSESEQAIHWLHCAARSNDAHARHLLKSLVLPVSGCDAEANSAIELVRRDDPWLAVRMELARHFGLTKVEALCVDPSQGVRPWGLVVGKNPFISQVRLSAARAIPAVSEAAMDVLQRAAVFFDRSRCEAPSLEGDLRRRSYRQRRAFERHGLDETRFFATASSMTLEALRVGPKWAFRAKKPLQLALAT
jgi:TPR repeat protein